MWRVLKGFYLSIYIVPEDMCTERYFWRKDAVCRQIVLVQYYSTSVRSVSGTRVLVLTATAQCNSIYAHNSAKDNLHYD